MKTHRSRLFWTLLLGAGLLYGALRWGGGFSLSALQQYHGQLLAWQAQAPLGFVAVFFGVYVLVTALSVPGGATALTLLAGAVLGWGWGLLLVSFASSLGALLAFWAARYVLRDAVEARWGTRLAHINQGLAREGAYYLFALRLAPIFPFFLINLLLGLTRMRSWTFYWVSQLGMLAGTAVYVNAGTQLGQLRSLQGLLSPGVWGALVLLGLFPWGVRLGLKLWQQQRVYAPWQGQRPRRFDRNLVVIGAGAGGLVSAYIAAAVKAKVTLVQAGPMGGDCLSTGCVPSKALIRAAELAQQARQAAQWGVHTGPVHVDWPSLMRRVQHTVADIAPHDSTERYTALGVEVLAGYGRIVNPWTVDVALEGGGTQRLTTRGIVIATGARPHVPAIPGLAEVGALTSDTLWAHLSTLPAVPARVLVLGGGPMGCEWAQALARLGAQVTLVERGPRLLAREEPAASDVLLQALQAEGVRVCLAHEVWQCAVTEGGAAHPGAVLKTACLRGPSGEETLVFDELLCALGRDARLDGYGLQALGIPTHRTIDTNAYLQTLYPNIYAVGDVAGPHQLTHAAAHQAWYAVVNALFGTFKKFKVDDSALPACTFTQPEVARVGLTEQQARAQRIPFETTRFDLADLDRALIDGHTTGFVQMLTVPGKDRILGVTLVGAHAGDLLAEYVLAMKHGLGLNRVLGTPHSYPTWAEANKYAAGRWKQAHTPHQWLAWVARFHAWRRGGGGAGDSTSL